MPKSTLPREIDRPDVRTEEGLFPQFKVIFLNDNVTTMEFVVRILIRLFDKDMDSAVHHMYEVHNLGSSHVATLPLERAEFKRDQVHTAARSEGFPFQCVLERA
jgi:ATP-dependent Clp protease adaptor protein ClpS